MKPTYEELEDRNATQAETIKALWHDISVIKKRDNHAQAYIPVLKDKIAHLEAQLTHEAKAERLFSNGK